MISGFAKRGDEGQDSAQVCVCPGVCRIGYFAVNAVRGRSVDMSAHWEGGLCVFVCGGVCG